MEAAWKDEHVAEKASFTGVGRAADFVSSTKTRRLGENFSGDKLSLSPAFFVADQLRPGHVLAPSQSCHPYY